MKRKRTVLNFITLICTLLIGAFGFACQTKADKESVVRLIEREGLYVMYCEESNGTDKLLDAMENLRQEGELAFEISGGMVTSIGGVANAADFTKCWMLYTSDAELSNTEWGVVEYDGESLGSAIVGVENLTIKTGEYYVWSYQGF